MELLHTMLGLKLHLKTSTDRRLDRLEDIRLDLTHLRKTSNSTGRPLDPTADTRVDQKDHPVT